MHPRFKQVHQKDEIVLYSACISNMGGMMEGRIIKRRKIRQFAFEMVGAKT